ncbi:MAG: type II toxin-antitoxin system VapC family toxin [Ardenticatenaceae bacterium]|nr:type II toxin-antitoxin system VapC family toxin [Ardenticatenaceae bacterium]
MIVIDASVWVSHLVASEINHVVSRRWLSDLVKSDLMIIAPAILLPEIGGAIARRTGEAELGHRAVNHVLSTPNFRVVSTDSEVGMAAAHLAAEYRLRGADSIYVAVAQQLKIPLVSWDREQIDRASGLIDAFRPE